MHHHFLVHCLYFYLKITWLQKCLSVENTVQAKKAKIDLRIYISLRKHFCIVSRKWNIDLRTRSEWKNIWARRLDSNEMIGKTEIIGLSWRWFDWKGLRSQQGDCCTVTAPAAAAAAVIFFSNLKQGVFGQVFHL